MFPRVYVPMRRGPLRRGPGSNYSLCNEDESEWRPFPWAHCCKRSQQHVGAHGSASCQGNRRSCGGEWHLRRPASLWRKGCPAVLPQCPSLRDRHTRRMEIGPDRRAADGVAGAAAVHNQIAPCQKGRRDCFAPNCRAGRQSADELARVYRPAKAIVEGNRRLRLQVP